jgi:hypothetical protein
VTVREYLFDSSRGNSPQNDWPSSGNITDLIVWLEQQRANAPEEYRGSVQCSLSVDYGYENSCSLEVEVYYDRPETVKEKTDRLEAEMAERKRREAKERIQLAKLQQKYGKRK